MLKKEIFRANLGKRFRQAREFLTRKEDQLLREIEDVENLYQARNRSCNPPTENPWLRPENFSEEDKDFIGINIKMEMILRSPCETTPTGNKEEFQKMEGTAPGELYCPNGLAVEPQSGIIYIADQDNNRVQDPAAWILVSHGRGNALIKLNNCRSEVNTKFMQISDNLLIRQNQLLSELDGIEQKYSESRNAENKAEKLRNEQNERLQDSSLSVNIIYTINQKIKSLDDQIAELRQKLATYTNIDIELDTDSINTLIDKLGSVILTEDSLQGTFVGKSVTLPSTNNQKENNTSGRYRLIEDRGAEVTALTNSSKLFRVNSDVHPCTSTNVETDTHIETDTPVKATHPSGEATAPNQDVNNGKQGSLPSGLETACKVDMSPLSPTPQGISTDSDLIVTQDCNKIGDIDEIPKVQIVNALTKKSTRKNVAANKDSPLPTSEKKEDLTATYTAYDPNADSYNNTNSTIYFEGSKQSIKASDRSADTYSLYSTTSSNNENCSNVNNLGQARITSHISDDIYFTLQATDAGTCVNEEYVHLEHIHADLYVTNTGATNTPESEAVNDITRIQIRRKKNRKYTLSFKWQKGNFKQLQFDYSLIMATAVTADTYLQQIHTARTQLLECFRRAHDLLAEREAHLLRQIETIQNDYEAETNSQQEDLQGLEVSKQALKNNLRNNDTLNKALAAINEQMDAILKLSSGTPRTIRFQWNTDLDRDLLQAGEIITTTTQHNQSAYLTPIIPPPANLTPIISPPANLYIPDYKNKSIPIITCCKHKESFSKGLAVEPQSGRIYIADHGNNRVQVFTPNGEYSFMFSSNMRGPCGICINNDTVYVSQWSSQCIVSYKLYGTYVNKVGSEGTTNGQFNYPRGLAVSPATGHLYVCDYGNNRVQVFKKKLKFHSILSNIVKYPIDVKLTNELVIILNEDNPCMHIFSITDHSLINSVISRGAGGQISYSLFFTLDAELNLLLTDCNNHCVKIFSLTGEFIAEIGKEGHKAGEFIKPAGIAIDGQNRIIVVSLNANASLQIF